MRSMCSAVGGSTGDNEPEPSFAFDTGGGSKHVNQSIATVSKTPSDAPDYGGAISVDSEGNVNGIDITMPVMNLRSAWIRKAM